MVNQSSHEMEPLQVEAGGNGGSGSSSSYWDKVFKVLSEADGHDVVDSGRKPSINIKKLKNFLNSERSLKVNREMVMHRHFFLN
jgi:hypothetical protein